MQCNLVKLQYVSESSGESEQDLFAFLSLLSVLLDKDLILILTYSFCTFLSKIKDGDDLILRFENS